MEVVLYGTLYNYSRISAVFNSHFSNLPGHSGRLHSITAQDESPVGIVLIPLSIVCVGFKGTENKKEGSVAYIWLIDNIEVISRHCGNENLAPSWE